MHDLTRTVAAVATPPGRGGVGCIRLSGPRAIEIARQVFRPAGRREPSPGDPPAFGRFLDREGTALDHGFLVLFPPQSSFTGETSAELWTHGSPAVQSALLDAALEAGAGAAGPGEFTYRALRNGRLDLPRAEAIRDLVAARTRYQARWAFARAEGALSKRLAPLREMLAETLARGEAAVEFPEEADTEMRSFDLERAVERALDDCRALLRGFRVGRIVREGGTVAIAGAPNVGKSSLFNRLLDLERAIVSQEPGTTRDTLEATVDVAGIPVRLIDTAGLRDAADPLEAEGVRRAHAARREADLEIFVVDGSRSPTAEELARLAHVETDPGAAPTIVAINKCDLSPHPGPVPIPDEGVRVSAKTGEGIEELRAVLARALTGGAIVEDPIVAEARHADGLRGAVDALARAAATMRSGLSDEVVLDDLRAALDRLGEITGESATEGLYERIFSTFCIGK